MISPLEQEKRKEQSKKQTKIMLSIVCLFISIVIFRCSAILKLNPRYTLIDTVELFFSAPLTAPPAISVFISLCASAMIFLLVSSSEYEKEFRKHEDPNVALGDAHFMNRDELFKYQTEKTTATFDKNRKYKESDDDIIFSKEIALSVDNKKTRLNCNSLVIGGSGAGKSFYFASPNLLQGKHNFIVTDPSGELKRDYAKYLENLGYEILTFDITDVYRSNKYNPFHYIREEKDILIMISTLIKNTKPEPASKSGDDFWENGEKMLLSAICLYLWHTADIKDQTFAKVLEMLNLAEIDENDSTAKSALDLLFEKLEKEDPQNLAVENYKKFKVAAGKTLKSFLISVNTRLIKLALPELKYLTSTDEFHFEDFANSKKAIFVITPTAEDTFQFLVSQLYSQFFMAVYDYAEKRAAYGYMIKIGNDVFKVFPSETEKGSQNAKKNAERFIKNCNDGLIIKPNKEKKYYEIRTKKTNELVTWRGKKEDAQQFIKSIKNATIEKCSSCCPRFVEIILDEFANIGQIPSFAAKLATIRKYRIMVAIIIQGLSQLKSGYGDKWSEIVGNCDVKLILGTDDPETNEFVSKNLLGNKTVVVENKSINSKKEVSYSYSLSQQPLMSATQLRLMNTDYCIVCIRTQPPYYGKKYQTLESPKFKFAQQYSGQFNIELSPEAINYKANTGPLRLRKSALIEKMITEAENTADKPQPVVLEKNKSARKQKNQQRLEKAKAEEDIAANDLEDSSEIYQYVPPTDYSQKDMLVFSTFGIDETSTDEDIEEAIDNTVIPLETVPDGKIKYAVTN